MNPQMKLSLEISRAEVWDVGEADVGEVASDWDGKTVSGEVPRINMER
jgi:hypothetical protein